MNITDTVYKIEVFCTTGNIKTVYMIESSVSLIISRYGWILRNALQIEVFCVTGNIKTWMDTTNTVYKM